MIEETTALKPNDLNDFNSVGTQLNHFNHAGVEITDEDRYTITPEGLAYLEEIGKR